MHADASWIYFFFKVMSIHLLHNLKLGEKTLAHNKWKVKTNTLDFIPKVKYKILAIDIYNSFFFFPQHCGVYEVQ